VNLWLGALDVFVRLIFRRIHEGLELLLFPWTLVKPQSGGSLYENRSIQSQDGGDKEVHGNDVAVDQAESSPSSYPWAAKALGVLSRTLGVPSQSLGRKFRDFGVNVIGLNGMISLSHGN